MSHTSTLTLLGQANESETGRSNSHGSPSPAAEKMTKSQLNLPIATAASADPHDGLRNGLRFRDSAALQSDDSQVIMDDNNNVKKSPEEDGSAGVAAASAKDTVRSNRMWGFFKVDQPVKTLNSILIPIYHLLCLYTIVTTTLDTNPLTIMWGLFMGGVAGFGVTGGVHRMWTHKSFKAKLPLRIILAACFSVSGQNTIYDWVRDHRVHHKYSETDADPHNSNRGFFFAHVGWLMMNKHPDVVNKGKKIDMSDILSDPVVQFHQKYFIPLKLLLCFIIPSLVPALCWNESWYNSIASQAVIRYVFSLNFTWLVNSAAHIWGNRPYDRRINPAQNIIVSFFAMGEGFHNYHHAFPWDYKAAELPYHFNFTTLLIDLFAKIGWAYDLKQPSKDLVRRTIEKYGDGTYPHSDQDHHDHDHHHHHHIPEVEYDADQGY